ncbi:MAG: zinc ABC transporter substrate-binding protein [Planctomycetota bacterium]
MRLNLNEGAGTGLGRRTLLAAMGGLLGAALAGCGAGGNGDGGGSTPLVVVTTGHIHDAAAAIVEGTDVELQLLCGPGVDPHSYSASTRDVLAMDRAAAILFNGFHLEAQLGEILDGGKFADKSWSMAGAFPGDQRLEWVEDGEVDPNAPFDPHIWNDLKGWSVCVEALAAHLGTVFPDEAASFAENGAAYVAKVREADAWASELLSKLPKERRFLVSGHDAFSYFARSYDMETMAVLGVGNDPEADLRTMRNVAEAVSERQVPVIFLESITNPKLTEALQEACEARGWQVKIADTPLYSDDLGDTAPVDTFLGAFRSNVETIVAALEV